MFVKVIWFASLSLFSWGVMVSAGEKKPFLDHKTVVEIGNRTAESSRYHLEDYHEPKVNGEYEHSKFKWKVHYSGKVPTPGNHFIVSIDNATRKAVILPGE